MKLNTTATKSLTYTSEDVLTVVKADAIRRGLVTHDCDVSFHNIRTDDRDVWHIELTDETNEEKDVPVTDPTRIVRGATQTES